MRIICPTCASHYEVELEKIAAQGQLVRCARCREVWLVRGADEAGPRPAEAAEAPPPPMPGEHTPRPSASGSTAPSEAVPSFTPQGHAPTPEVVDFQAARIRLRPRERGTGTGRGRATSLSGWAAGAVILSTLLSLYGFRVAIATHLPVAGRAYAALGLPAGPPPLALRDVHSVIVADGGDKVLTLEGTITNVSDAPAEVPGITVVVRSDSKAPLYTWTTAPPKPRLASGETVDFKARLDSPPSGGHDVRVSFAPAGNAMAQLAP